MRYDRNPNFTGREGMLGELRRALTSGQTTALTQAIHGLGGVGKTQLAVEYAYRWRDEYETVWWVRAEEPAVLVSDLAGLAQAWGVGEGKDAAKAAEAALGEMARRGGWLVVYHNAKDRATVREYLPQGARGHLIITSRSMAWGAVGTTVEVPPLPVEEAAAFLMRRAGDEDETAAAELAKELGGLPLALEQAGAYCEEKGIGLAEYLTRFRRPGFQARLLALNKPDEYPQAVAGTWLAAMEEVEAEAPLGAGLLKLWAFLAPDDIPDWLMLGRAEQLPEGLRGVADEMALDDAMGALGRYSLARREAGWVSVHRLVQAVTRQRLGEEERKGWAQAAVGLLNAAYPYDVQTDVANWPVCEALLGHGLAAAGHAEALRVGGDAASRLLNQMGSYLETRAQYKEALAAHEQALTIAERIYGADHHEVAIHANNLGTAMKKLGNLPGARAALERALRIGERVYGPDDARVAIIVNNLASVLHGLGDLVGAKAAYERALPTFVRVLGPEDRNMATLVNNLGSVLRAQGDSAGAKALFERALRIDEGVYGPDHPTIATDVNNLGLVLRDQGDLAGAKALFERALRIDEGVYDPDHHKVARDVNNLGSVLWDQGDLAGAKALFERALRICEQSLGLEHQNTRIVRGNLEEVEGEIRRSSQ